MAGLLQRFLGGTSVRPEPIVHTVEVTLYEGSETLEVVGESHYQDTLWQLVGGFTTEYVRRKTHALLIPDPSNEYDPNAIEVRISGLLVGYLSREDAAAYLPGLRVLIEKSTNHLVALQAWIVGGGERSDGIGRLGVFLDHDPADFGLPSHHVSLGHSLRTGWSEALATDLADDSYDLSWYTTLSESDATACAQLRELLQHTDDPIDRHYMFAELEHRLYRSRKNNPSALDEFDKACREHDREMETIRPALLEKFGAVPVIEMYRQAAIRCQKEKCWEAARIWAERGIEIYGDDPARPEVVDDLRKRVAHATAKMEAASQPQVHAPQAVVRTSIPDIETLTCASCGMTFQRTRTRGRKPSLCPACRGRTKRTATPVSDALT